MNRTKKELIEQLNVAINNNKKLIKQISLQADAVNDILEYVKDYHDVNIYDKISVVLGQRRTFEIGEEVKKTFGWLK